MLTLPPQVHTALDRLTVAGWEAYVVGGAVRDALRGCPAGDWDITTNAEPAQVERVFAGERLIETGLKHGTVTVLLDGLPLEITTYRVDGDYTDHRRPDAVRFTRSLREDLMRRDFTMNALAYNPRTGLVDICGGAEDIARGVVRCVGEPDRRFQEDGLRILRALRFASVLGFQIAPETAAAIHRSRALLQYLAAERVRSELTKLLCGQNVGAVLREFADVLAVPIPELRPMFGFEQHNPHHDRDVWQHTAAVVEHIPPEPVLRWTMLLHDGQAPLFHRGRSGRGPFLRPPQGIGGAGGDRLPPTADGQAHRPSGGDAGAVARSGHPADGEGHRTRRPPAGGGHVPAAAGGKAGGQSGPASRLPLSSGGH